MITPCVNPVVVRNNVVEKLTLPIHIRDASRRGLVWRSHEKVRKVEPLVLRRPEPVGFDQECQSQRAMRPASIVVPGPLTKGSPHVRCVQWDEIVQAFASYASNQPFAMSVGGGHTNRRSQYVDAPAFDRLIQTGRERLVSIVQKKLVVLIARKASRSCCRVHSEVGCSVTLK